MTQKPSQNTHPTFHFVLRFSDTLFGVGIIFALSNDVVTEQGAARLHSQH